MAWRTRNPEKPINQYSERLPDSLRDKLFEYLLNTTTGEVHDQIDEYLQQFNRVLDNEQRHITLEETTELLQFVNMTLADLYDIWGVSLTWDSSDTESFYTAMCELDQRGATKMIRYLLTFSAGCTAPFFADPKMETAMPSGRFMVLRKRLYSKSGRLSSTVDPKTGEVLPSIDEQIMAITNSDNLNLWEDRHYRSKFSTAFFPSLANLFHVSLKWIWRLDSDFPCWTRNLVIDNTMSNYLLSSEQSRSAMRALAQRMLAMSRKETTK